MPETATGFFDIESLKLVGSRTHHTTLRRALAAREACPSGEEFGQALQSARQNRYVSEVLALLRENKVFGW